MRSTARHLSGMLCASCLLAVLLLNGCAGAAPQPAATLPPSAITLTAHTTLLHLADVGGATLACIADPWHKDSELARYLMVPRADTTWTEARLADMAGRCKASVVVRTPLERSTVCASCHFYLLQELGALDCVAAVCDADYTQLPSLHRRLADGRLRDAGSATVPNLEVIMEAQSDAIWISPFENAGLGPIATAGLAVVCCADYLEPHPLARAEWMKWYGRLVGKDAEADSLFAIVEDRYRRLSRGAGAPSQASAAPTLLTDLPTGSTWYVPGGQSTMGRLYQDAGFAYPWADDRHAGSLALSPEAVVARGMDCDVWLFKYYDRTKPVWSRADLLSQDPLFGRFKAVQEGRMYGCNTAWSRYFDETPFRPDLLLATLRHLTAPADSTFTHLGDTTTAYFLPIR